MSESFFKPNPKFERDFDRMVQRAGNELATNLNKTLQRFSVEYAGQDVSVVKPALATAWARTNEGAHIDDSELAQCAAAVSRGGRIWIDGRGHVMIDDGAS